MIRCLDHDQPAHRFSQLFARGGNSFVSVLAFVPTLPGLIHLRGPP